MSKKRDAFAAKARRAHIKRLMAEGMKPSQIAKATGYGYKHVANIVAQESAEQVRA